MIDREKVLKDIKENGLSLECYKEYNDDTEVVIEAVKQDGWALEYASQRLQNNKEIVLEAVKEDYRVKQFASPRLQNDEEVLRFEEQMRIKKEELGISYKKY